MKERFLYFKLSSASHHIYRGILKPNFAFIPTLKVRGFGEAVIKMGILSGVIWNIGNLLSLLAISQVGLSKAIPISQSAVLVAVSWGLFFFNEIKERRYRFQILIGAVTLLTGIFVLGGA